MVVFVFVRVFGLAAVKLQKKSQPLSSFVSVYESMHICFAISDDVLYVENYKVGV